MRRVTESRSGKIWTTSERRLISRLRRSMGLFDQTFCQCSRGCDAKPVRSASASSSIAVISGNEERRLSVTAMYWAVKASGVVCAQIVDTGALTGLERADTVYWGTLRGKGTRHLCHPA